MIKVISFDCWDTIIKNNSIYEDNINACVQKYFMNNWNLPYKTSKKCLLMEEACFSKQLKYEFKTANIKERIKYLFNCATVIPTDSQFNSLLNLIEDQINNPLPVVTDSYLYSFLSKLKNNFKLVLICNTGWFSGNAIKNVLLKHNLTPYFSSMIFSDELEYAKPDPSIFKIVLKKLEISPEEIIHIGDKISTDYMGALYMNIKFIQFRTINSGEREISDSYTSFKHLQNYLYANYLID